MELLVLGFHSLCMETTSTLCCPNEENTQSFDRQSLIYGLKKPTFSQPSLIPFGT